ncbi:MAG: YqgE/AlgH family protein, partial [Rhodospirillaceae bacterium]|nr:YqgE/AlgH family protein [Rhodospirillaceae bacterium]
MLLHTNESSGYLTGQFLIAMPQIRDQRFSRALIYLCAHTADGAMGLVVNRLFVATSFQELLHQFNIVQTSVYDPIRIHFGGPIEIDRGFVLHSADYVRDATLMIDEHVGLTMAIDDVLKDIVEGRGPRKSMFALGYAGWISGQLDREIKQNSWLNAPADEELLFGIGTKCKWERAIAGIGC